MCSACEPIQIVHMLNSMYSRFDRLSSLHDVYKVETIGDAYMVVGGVPVPTATHAHNVANFALGMRIAARDVTNPVSGEPIQIRVGLHTGPVLAGVVGQRMPRYCLFGDTVNTASRMESHGLPDHIHLSAATYSELRDSEFKMAERGQIEVKGKGLMSTYFLLRNTNSSEDAIMGRENSRCDLPAVQQNVEGKSSKHQQSGDYGPSESSCGPLQEAPGSPFAFDITWPYPSKQQPSPGRGRSTFSPICRIL
uniref:guanylate cyclase n=1 Tax=Knipowitschia caucasica TaxID=637954 RepID=A0AAV2LBF0_KNICA